MAIDLDVHGNTQPLEAAVQAAVNRIRRTPIKITVDDRGATQPLGNMKRGADEFTKSMEAANARILAFGASMAIINGVADSFKAMVRNMVEVEKAMADINVVMGLSSQSLEKFGDGLFKVAKETGAAFNIAAQAATEYARQGLAVEESLKRTRDALILTRLTGMDSAEAVKSLTAAMNTYGNQIKDTTQLVSKFAAVDVQFAVSAEDFAQAISRTGAAAKGAGVDIDELIGIVTAAQQQTARGGAVIGNSLKTIFTRIGRADTLNQLESLGIAVRDVEGNTIGAKKILADLANTFDKLGEAQKSQIAQTVGGVFQINILKAILGDAAKQNGILARATQISSSATDEAIDKNEQLRNTMAAMATETGLSLKQLSAEIGELMLAPGVEKILNTVKSLSEGISGALGDGESIGGKFGKGFLTGIGNIITGPGLVVVFAVLGKLAAQAFKFTKESLTSLVGVTSESQKQKAIQTSLVTLFGQNAALNKEILRTDISRTEKEKIILGLLQAQTVEANKLNAISKQLASTLYSRGYGPNLTKGKSRAYGHIPNFAHPEREQAAKGGYAAGTIRSINMPGEGSVIYNSAEKVKNFKGMSQPAIMPPQSSKAGKNYQQAFGNIHGFDPYAAGGYIPNFARLGMSNAKFAAKINRGEMTVDEAVAKGYTGGLAGKTVSKTSDLKNQRFKHLNKGGSQYVVLVASEGPDSVAGHYFVGNKKMSPNRAYQYPSAFKNKKGVNPARVDVPFYSLDARDQDLNSGKNSPYRNAIYSGLKESGSNLISKILTDLGFGSKAGKRNILTDRDVSAMGGNVFEGVIASVLNDANFKNYQSRGETARIDLPKDDDLYRLFGVKGGSLGAEAKITSGKNNIKDAAVKFYDMLAFGGGFVPNFANPLSDAIGREKAAGVPVSQIRVGSHSALMSKGNPLGLGVTNTHDEPNGLRDVFGAANGFVPNYAFNLRSDFQAGRDEYKAAAELQKEINKENKKLLAEKRKLSLETNRSENTEKRLTAITKQLTKNKQDFSAATKMASDATKKMSIAGRAGGAIQNISNLNQRFANSTIGRGLSGGGGMGLMIGAPMLAGYLQSGGAAEGGFGYKAGGALMGAGTGASIGMMFGPIGIAVGGVVGAFAGLVGAIDETEEALRKASVERNQQLGELGSTLAPVFAKAGSFDVKPLSAKDSIRYENLEKQLNEIGDSQGGNKYQGLSKIKQGLSGLPSHLTGGMSKEEIGKFAYTRYEKSKGTNVVFDKAGILSQAEKNLQGLFDRAAILQSLESLPSDYKFQAETVPTRKGEKAVSKLFSGTEYAKELEKLPLSEFQTVIKKGKEKTDIYNDTLDQQNEAVILQLNLQKAQLSAQQAAAEKQFKIKNTFSEISNSLDLQAKIMGSFATEQQKAQMDYVKSINKASEKYSLSAETEDQKLRQGLIGIIGDPSIKSKLKTALAKEQLQTDFIGPMRPSLAAQFEGGSDLKFNNEQIQAQATLIDLTKELSALSAEELETKLRSLGLSPIEIQQIEILKAAKNGNLKLALEELQASQKRLVNEFKINDAIARRKDLISDMKTSARIGAETVGSAGRIRSMDAQVAAAERLGAIGPGYQTSADQEAFQIEEKRIALQNKSLEIREQAGQKMNDELIKLADLKMQDEELIKLKEKGINLSPKEFANLQALEENSKKRKEEQDNIVRSVQRTNKEAEKEISTAEKLLQLEEERLRAKRLHETGPGAFGRGMQDSFKSMREQAQYMDYQLGEKIPFAFADGMASAMTEAINGTKDLKDALSDAAMGFLGMIQQAMMQSLAYRLVGGMGFAMPGMMSRGGNVRNYSRGGGVPARVSDGEYVMGRDAVNKYGGSFMHGLNAGGRIPGFSDGGSVERDLIDQGVIKRESDYSGTGAKGSALAANFGGGRGFKSGRQYQRRAMSSFFYKQSGNVGLEEDVGAMGSILQEEESRRQEAERKRQEKKAKRRQLIGMLISTAAMAGISHLMGPAAATSGGLSGASASGPVAGLNADVAKLGFDPYSSSTAFVNSPINAKTYDFSMPLLGQYLGGPIRKYASGGYISGKSGIDQIPAMLSEGEYVIRASSARQIGKPMLDRINAGKFNEGGPVTEMEGSQESSNTGSGNTNNINISINLEKGSSKEDASKNQNKEGDRSNEQMKEFSDKIKKQVLSVIVEEQRPGGLLQDTK